MGLIKQLNAISRGDLEEVKATFGLGRALTTGGGKIYNFTEQHMFDAVECGKPDVVEWLASMNCPTSQRSSKAAVKLGELSIVKCLYAIGCPFSPHLNLSRASSEIDSFVREIAWNITSPALTRMCVIEAIRAGDIPRLVMLRARNCPWPMDTMSIAIGANQLEVAIWLYESYLFLHRNDDEPAPGTWRITTTILRPEHFTLAMNGGCIKIVRWLISAKCPVPVKIVSNDDVSFTIMVLSQK